MTRGSALGLDYRAEIATTSGLLGRQGQSVRNGLAHGVYGQCQAESLNGVSRLDEDTWDIEMKFQMKEVTCQLGETIRISITQPR
jgi:hypothetical protein